MSSVTTDKVNNFASNYVSYINRQNQVNKNVIDISNSIYQIEMIKYVAILLGSGL